MPLYGAATHSQDHLEASMYICLCNALTERQVRQAAARGDGSALGVYHACGTQPRCGKCMPLVEGIVRDVISEPIRVAG
jgi:bacterioferritin-associated ferredoxin